jgi:hypothetical protein
MYEKKKLSINLMKISFSFVLRRMDEFNKMATIYNEYFKTESNNDQKEIFNAIIDS